MYQIFISKTLLFQSPEKPMARVLAFDIRGCRAQVVGQAWVYLECHYVLYFTKAL